MAADLDALAAKLRAEGAQQDPEQAPARRDPLAAGTAEFSRQLVSNIVNLPDAVVTGVLARALRAAGVDSPVSRLEPGDLGVDVEDIQAGAGTVDQIARTLLSGEVPDPGSIFSQQQEAFRRMTAERREEAPIASQVGRMGADAATLFTGRIPARAGARALAGSRIGQGFRIPSAAEMPASISKEAVKILQKPGIRRLLRGTGRSAEAGLEGLSLAILDRSDPLETAFWTGGIQAGGSLALEGFRQARQHPLAASVFLTGATIQVLKESTPGGRDRILESLETAAGKIPLLLGASLLAAAGGSGRITGDTAKNLGNIADAITAIPRGSIQSLVKDLARDDQTRGVLEVVTGNPAAFDTETLERIDAAIRDPGRKVSAEVNRLMRTRSFRDRLVTAREQLQQRASQPEPDAAQLDAILEKLRAEQEAR